MQGLFKMDQSFWQRGLLILSTNGSLQYVGWDISEIDKFFIVEKVNFDRWKFKLLIFSNYTVLYSLLKTVELWRWSYVSTAINYGLITNDNAPSKNTFG